MAALGSLLSAGALSLALLCDLKGHFPSQREFLPVQKLREQL